jgi:hypothetical protein
MNPRSRKQKTPVTREPGGQRRRDAPKPAPQEHQNRGGERPSTERRAQSDEKNGRKGRRIETGGVASPLRPSADRSGPPRHHHRDETGDGNEDGGAGGLDSHSHRPAENWSSLLCRVAAASRRRMREAEESARMLLPPAFLRTRSFA